MLIYNTLSEKKEPLEKPGAGPMKIFVCGPTVYDYAHIGNARTYIAFDIFIRYLRSLGWKVFYLQNITDIDDKIINRSHEEHTTPESIARKYKKAYQEDIKKLGVTSVTKYAPATKYIPQIVKQIKTLIKKGNAYKIKGDGYYFNLSTFPEYGKLSKRTILQAEDAVSRIDEGINKKNKGDFTLWKFSKDDEPGWQTELGYGRPGWHIEDTAISEHYFGPQYDIHGGALDLKFPHHEAEIAQQESASNKKPFVKIWMHAGFLLVNGKKMSKSQGNFISIRDFLKNYSPDMLRYLIASHHYRSPINYTEELARQTAKTLDSLTQFAHKIDFLIKKQKKSGSIKNFKELVNRTEKSFLNAMKDDFNTPQALAAIFTLLNEINKKIWQLGKKDAKTVKKWLLEKLNIFNIQIKTPKIPIKILRLAKKRELLRSNQQFTQSDHLRKTIESLGYIVEDTPIGPLILSLIYGKKNYAQTSTAKH